MAQIKIDLLAPPVDGMDIKFKAPCNCTEVTGILVAYPDGEQEFTFRDAHCNDLAGLGNLFAAGAYVKVILDTQNGFAYLQNADTNAYLETKVSMDLLWTNANTKSTFASQTLELGLNDYDMYIVTALHSTSAANAVSGIQTVGSHIRLNSATASTSSSTIFSRLIDYVASNGSLKFYDCRSNGSVDNSNIIPQRIYGIKGVRV